MKSWLKAQRPGLTGAALAGLILCLGPWFTYLWVGSWEAVGYPSRLDELWSSCCRDRHYGEISGGSSTLGFVRCLAGWRFENLLCAVIVLAIGFFAGNFYGLWRQREGLACHRAFWWGACIVGLAWLGLVVNDYGHKVEYPAFPLFIILLLSAWRRQAIHSRAVRLNRMANESGP